MGSGEAKINASTTARSSADGITSGGADSADGSCDISSATAASPARSCSPAPSMDGSNSTWVSSFAMCAGPTTYHLLLRITNRMRGISRARTLVDAYRPKAARLEDPNQFQPDHFEQCEKRHDHEPPRAVP